ncbi:hypothetical protein K470DRAFT_267697 [Piedraia hortae CBS 480.64]|uniref:Uncharacterized protein n=1 Tax=Piedraia hortae CBS 480.64 TaxID=1314780 RepID=A0A6A7C9I6_9PEZI|nr:hypothetical protein K470DRAFT_267697 [Piedraia hortae CBS 480.64]
MASPDENRGNHWTPPSEPSQTTSKANQSEQRKTSKWEALSRTQMAARRGPTQAALQDERRRKFFRQTREARDEKRQDARGEAMLRSEFVAAKKDYEKQMHEEANRIGQMHEEEQEMMDHDQEAEEMMSYEDAETAALAANAPSPLSSKRWSSGTDYSALFATIDDGEGEAMDLS